MLDTPRNPGLPHRRRQDDPGHRERESTRRQLGAGNRGRGHALDRCHLRHGTLRRRALRPEAGCRAPGTDRGPRLGGGSPVHRLLGGSCDRRTVGGPTPANGVGPGRVHRDPRVTRSGRRLGAAVLRRLCGHRRDGRGLRLPGPGAGDRRNGRSPREIHRSIHGEHRDRRGCDRGRCGGFSRAVSGNRMGGDGGPGGSRCRVGAASTARAC